MIKNFVTVKKQLRELSSVINSFKSEAVQLRIIELIFGIMPEEEVQDEDNPKDIKPKAKKAKRKKKALSKSSDSSPKPRKNSVTAGTGSMAILTKLVEGKFFSKPKTIGDIVKHCDTALARKFKANDFSGRLARMTRDGKLTRKKNKDKQYEYTKA